MQLEHGYLVVWSTKVSTPHPRERVQLTKPFEYINLNGFQPRTPVRGCNTTCSLPPLREAVSTPHPRERVQLGMRIDAALWTAFQPRTPVRGCNRRESILTNQSIVSTPHPRERVQRSRAIRFTHAFLVSTPHPRERVQRCMHGLIFLGSQFQPRTPVRGCNKCKLQGQTQIRWFQPRTPVRGCNARSYACTPKRKSFNPAPP